MSDIILEVKDLTKRFGGLTAVDNVSLHLKKGEIVGLIGANGAGKTTLFNMISGNFAPTSGKIIYKGQEIQGMPPQKICKLGFGRTYQIVQPFTALTLRENVMAGALMRHPKIPDALKIADQIIETLGIYVLNQGKLISQGTPAEVMADPEVIKSYIGEKRYAS